jgi:hypothetical protein
MANSEYSYAEEGVLNDFPDGDNFGVRSLTFVNKRTGNVIKDAINIDSKGNLNFKDVATKTTLKKLINESKGYAEEKDEDGDSILYFFDNRNEKISLGEIVDKLFVSNITKGIRWFHGRAMENLSGECGNMDQWIVDNFFNQKVERSATDLTDVDYFQEDFFGGWKNVWHDVPCLEVITDDFVDNKYINVSSVVHYSVNAPKEVVTGFRIYDATADIELARTVHIASGSTDVNSDGFITYSVPIDYQGPMPDTPLSPESQCKKITFRDLQNIQAESQKARGAELQVSQEGYAMVPFSQHVIKVQWCICELALTTDAIGNKVGSYNREFFEFGDSSLDVVMFNNNTVDVDRIQLADKVEITTLTTEEKEKREAEVKFDIVPFFGVPDYSLILGTNGNFNAWVTAKTDQGFTVKWDRTLDDAIIDWSVYHQDIVENEMEKINDKSRILNHFLFPEKTTLDFCQETEEDGGGDCPSCFECYWEDEFAYEKAILWHGAIRRVLMLIDPVCEANSPHCLYEVDFVVPLYLLEEEVVAYPTRPFLVCQTQSIFELQSSIKSMQLAIEDIEDSLEALGVISSEIMSSPIVDEKFKLLTDWILDITEVFLEWLEKTHLMLSVAREVLKYLEENPACPEISFEVLDICGIEEIGTEIIEEYPEPILCPYKWAVTVKYICYDPLTDITIELIQEIETCTPITFELEEECPEPPPPCDGVSWPPFPEPPIVCPWTDDLNFEELIVPEEEIPCKCCDCCNFEDLRLSWRVGTGGGTSTIPDTNGHIYFIEDDLGDRRYSTNKTDLFFTLDIEYDVTKLKAPALCDVEEVDYLGKPAGITKPFQVASVRTLAEDEDAVRLFYECKNNPFQPWQPNSIETTIYDYTEAVELGNNGGECLITFLPEVMTEINLESIYGYNHTTKPLRFNSDAQFIEHDALIEDMLEDSLNRLESDKKQKPNSLPVQKVGSGLLILGQRDDDYDLIFTPSHELKMFDSLDPVSVLNKSTGFLGSSAFAQTFVWFDPRSNVVIAEEEKALYPGHDPIYSKTTKEELLEYIYSAVYPAIKIPVFPNFKVGNFIVNGSLYNPLFDIRNYRIPGIYASSQSTLSDGDLFKTKDVFEYQKGIQVGLFLKISGGELSDDSYVILEKDLLNTIPQKTTVTNGLVDSVTPSGLVFRPITEDLYNLNVDAQ